MTDQRPYATAIAQAMAVLTEISETRAVTIQECAELMTAHVRRVPGGEEVTVHLTPEFEYLVVFPGNIALEVTEADLIHGVMSPETFVALPQSRMIH